jgi:hypothetical protein
VKPIFAKETAVPVGRSRSELEDLLRKYGADQFASGWREGGATVQFRLEGRTVRLEVPMPTLKDVPEKNGRGRMNQAQREKELQQMERQRWRAIVLLTRARLEACALGIETIETAFLSGFVTPSGQTVGEIMREQLDKVLDGRAQPKMLGA